MGGKQNRFEKFPVVLRELFVLLHIMSEHFEAKFYVILCWVTDMYQGKGNKKQEVLAQFLVLVLERPQHEGKNVRGHEYCMRKLASDPPHNGRIFSCPLTYSWKNDLSR